MKIIGYVLFITFCGKLLIRRFFFSMITRIKYPEIPIDFSFRYFYAQIDDKLSNNCPFIPPQKNNFTDFYHPSAFSPPVNEDRKIT